MKRTAHPKLDVFPAAKQRRLDALLEKNAEGTLTAREERALKELVAEAETLMIANARRLAPIPGVIVQGRYDIVCPTISADDLHQAWPEAEYVIVPDAGHSAFEPGIRSRLVSATEAFKKRL